MDFSDIFKKGALIAFADSGISFKYVLIALFACGVVSLAIGATYWVATRNRGFTLRYAASLGGMALITVAIVLTVRSSVVVSLGMVGALTVVRYRTALRSTLDMLFMFWAISAGIICGSGLYFIAVPLTLAMAGVVVAAELLPDRSGKHRLLALDGRYPYDEAGLKEALKAHARWYRVRTENIHNDDVNLVIEVRRLRDEDGLIRRLSEGGDFHDVSLLTQEGVVD